MVNPSSANVRVFIGEKVAMRDGVSLATTMVLPPGAGPFPVVLLRTPYNRVPYVAGAGEFNAQGIALVVQDCRGRYGSEGEFYPWLNERNDGLDTLDWIAAQPWCNGHIAMSGDSYLGGDQLALADTGHPCLKALNPRFVAADLGHCFQRDGVFSLALTFSWLCLEVAERSSTASLLPLYDVPALLRHLPLQTLDEKIGAGVLQPFRDYVNHESGSDFWKAIDYRASLAHGTTPTLFTAGWYDYYAGDAARDFMAARQNPDAAIASSHRLLIGPWTHGVNTSSQLGDVDFGIHAHEEDGATMRWLHGLLTGGTATDVHAAPVRIFVMGINQWRDEYEWPLARTVYTSYFLQENGGLGVEKPQAQAPDHYVYDPQHPTPTLGGNHSVGPYNPGLYEHCLPGPYDQTAIEARDDVLVYSTEILPADVEVTGPVCLTLFASSSAPDTDFVARLCDVYPDGRSINITEGVLRARFRDRNPEQTPPLEPDTVYEFFIDLQATSNVFLAGHRIRLQITSSNFPLWDRNLNTGASIASDTAWQSAQQTIYHNAQFPSHLTLPIIPVI